MVTGSDAVQQVPHPAIGVGDVEGLGDPVSDLSGGQEATRGNLLLELLDLCGSESASTTLILEGTQGLQTLSAEQAEPLADLSWIDAEKVSYLPRGAAVGGPQDGTEALRDSLVGSLATATEDFLTQRRFQDQCHANPFRKNTPGNGYRRQ